ncbi:MAG: DNA-directed RNA polymerase subunit A' [Candidatus Aenigmatarchaeota archaeon]
MSALIEAIEFKLFSPMELKKLAVSEINKAELYDNDGFPIEGGVMDPRLGVVDPGLRCRTCGLPLGNCPGHFGWIELIRPVIHVLYGKLVHRMLRMACPNCGKTATTNPTVMPKACPHCGIALIPVRFEKPYTYFEGEKILNPLEIRQRMEKIPDEELPNMNFLGGRPEWLVLTILPVPPVIARPSITLETGERSEDDLTHKLVDIIRINQRLRENIDIGAPDFIIEDLWELLQYHVATFYDNELPGIPAARHRSGRPLKTLADRLKSKEGRFRQNLAGKRVNFSARTVISPDTHISINEVGVPLSVAKELTIPVVVQAHNIEALKALIMRAPAWPSANYVIRPDGRRKRITEDNHDEILKELAIGYVVERQLHNGDVVLFNRQPSLHRMSIMAHKVRVSPWRTFTMNTPVCPPYNADFDGDEMNLHVLQNEEAQAEARMLMSSEKHIRSPRFGGPIIGMEHDHISGLYMLTRDGTEMPIETAYAVLAEVGAEQRLPNKKTVTGKEVFSSMLPRDLNLTIKSVTGAPVVIEKGMLKEGVIDKKSVGREAGKLLDRIDREYGSETARLFIDRAALLGIKWLERSGFSVGLDDFDIPRASSERIKVELEKGDSESNKLIEQYRNGTLEVLPGRTATESFESHMLRMLANVTDAIGKIIDSSVTENHAVVMARSGARGSITHMVQLMGSVGQERVMGERVQRGYRGRTLSHFAIGDLSPAAHGFVSSAFKKGLNPFEFFFDLLSGREGLMDKSLRTRHSGYLERRLMNALQDLKIEYDGTVRDNRKIIIQFTPGEDGIDPSKSDWGKIDVNRVIERVTA